MLPNYMKELTREHIALKLAKSLAHFTNTFLLKS